MTLFKSLASLFLCMLLCLNAQAETASQTTAHKGKHTMVKLHTNHGEFSRASFAPLPLGTAGGE